VYEVRLARSARKELESLPDAALGASHASSTPSPGTRARAERRSCAVRRTSGECASVTTESSSGSMTRSA
jgi:hypothetical protein